MKYKLIVLYKWKKNYNKRIALFYVLLIKCFYYSDFICRALEVFAQSGKTLSEIFEEQRNEEGGSNLGGPLRYPHIIMFWLQCDQVRLARLKCVL